MNEPNGWTTITSKSDVVEDFKRANEIWAKAGVIFIIKEINFPKANTKILRSKKLKNYSKGLKKTQNRDDAIRYIVNKKNNKIRGEILYSLTNHKKNRNKKALNIYYLPQLLTISCGLTELTFDKQAFKKNLVYIIMPHQENDFMKHINSNCRERHATLSHELGHLFGMKHPKIPKKNKVKKEANLMEYGESFSDQDIIEIKKFILKNYKKIIN